MQNNLTILNIDSINYRSINSNELKEVRLNTMHGNPIGFDRNIMFISNVTGYPLTCSYNPKNKYPSSWQDTVEADYYTGSVYKRFMFLLLHNIKEIKYRGFKISSFENINTKKYCEFMIYFINNFIPPKRNIIIETNYPDPKTQPSCWNTDDKLNEVVKEVIEVFNTFPETEVELKNKLEPTQNKFKELIKTEPYISYEKIHLLSLSNIYDAGIYIYNYDSRGISINKLLELSKQ